MARRRDYPERQVHPTGELFSVDDSWRDSVRKELELRGWDQAELAKQIGCTAATVTHLLKPTAQGGSKQSRYVRDIHKAFNWKDITGPVVAVTADDALRFITKKWPSLSETDRAAIRALVDSLTTKR
jgi:acyl CoA:acetate/3-ketoacid CoA transferase alpha subunit